MKTAMVVTMVMIMMMTAMVVPMVMIMTIEDEDDGGRDNGVEGFS